MLQYVIKYEVIDLAVTITIISFKKNEYECIVCVPMQISDHLKSYVISAWDIGSQYIANWR